MKFFVKTALVFDFHYTFNMGCNKSRQQKTKMT